MLPQRDRKQTSRPAEDDVSAIDRVRIARETYGGYESGDRSAVERHLASDFEFYSPADVGIRPADLLRALLAER